MLRCTKRLRSRDEPGTSPDLPTPYPRHRVPLRACRLVTEGSSSTTTSVLAKIIGGWQLSGIIRYTSGATLGVSATQANPVYRGGATAEGIGGSTAIPQTADVVAGVPMVLDTKDFDPRADRYLNAAAFAQPTAAFGTSMLTIDGLRGFASLNEDLALAKTSGCRDARRFRFAWRCSTHSTVWSSGTRRATSGTRKHSDESRARRIRLETCRLR